MKLFDNLTEENWSLYAMKHYDNPGCISVEEFYDDLARVKYIKRLFRRYKNKKDIDSLKARLCLNHIIILFNVFPREVATRILYLKLEKDLWPLLKSFLSFLSFQPDVVQGINMDDILSVNIGTESTVDAELEKI